MGGMTALRLAKAGWNVDVTGRDGSRMPVELLEAGVRFHQIERSNSAGIEGLLGGGADLLVDLTAYTAADVRAILPVMASVTCPVLVSSRAVYADRAGRHVNSDESPRFEQPICEDAPTLPPAGDDVSPYSREGYAPCKVAAELAALDSGLPVTVIRPSKVHGRWARQARTQGIVEHMLRGEPTIELADPETIDHLSAAANAAALIETLAAHPGARILNAADPDTPSAVQIVQAIAAQLAWSGTIELVPTTSNRGQHPWRTAMTLDTTASRDLGYKPAGTSLELLADEVEWVQAQTSPG
ncbi:nucleoside-diphosphate sugar epimerase [Arthrobacter sp. PM3]|nr:nucleoside-diphosphate sugar epimerase [Arthrobacter sp. PM3]AXJ09338.1 nucleoside-diphosphate sugar epimerase [Arthrobacter sp. PM3]